MLANHWKKSWYREHRGVLHLILVFALLFLLGHVSQHDLPNINDNNNTQCEFCLNGTGPLGIATTELHISADSTEPLFNQPLKIAVVYSYLGFSYTSRAPPAV